MSENQKISPETERWLAERRRSGNWMAVAPNDEIPTDILGWDRTMLHMFQIAFSPEIERRIASGPIDYKFVLIAAQMLQPEHGPQIIRLNEEVRGIALIKSDRPIDKGDPVLVSDMRGLVSFDLEEAELDAGHFTIFWREAGWIATFDFRSGRAKSAQMIESARQFLSASKYSAVQGHAGPSVDNLFSACELASKARLILHRNPAARAKTHRSVGSAINAWGRLGNVDEAFLGLFNRMSNSRSSARYDVAARVDQPTPSDFEIVTSELELLEKSIAHRIGTELEAGDLSNLAQATGDSAEPKTE